jgi:lysyl-tRNA synthetase class 2
MNRTPRPRARAPVHVERHALGPRLYVFGRRVHECHAGTVLVLASLSLLAFEIAFPEMILFVTLAIGGWLLVKDWQDFFPGRRDVSAWCAGIHRPPLPLREAHRADWLPPLLGRLAVLVGVVNLASALTPDLGPRARLVRDAVPAEVPLLAHAFALSAGAALVVLGFYLGRRRRRAWWAAVFVLFVAGVVNLLKGLDVEEALVSWALAAVVAWARDAFYVRQRTPDRLTASKRIATLVGGCLATIALALVAASHWGSPGLTVPRALGELIAPLTVSAGPIHYRDPFDWIPLGIGMIELGALLTVAYMAFRPLARPGRLPEPGMQMLAREIVHSHGRDTLSFFKLRTDQPYFFDSSKRAFAAYRIESGVLLVSGDPVGPPEALPDLVRELCGFAEIRNLKVGVVGASEEFARLSTRAGLKSLYIGDEAIVEVERFSLDGRAMRKVRQSVGRLERAGYEAGLVEVGELDGGTLAALELVSEHWRRGARERGFSMAMEGLRGEHLRNTSVVVARDADMTPRAFLHFVPTAANAMSLSFMRRDPETPNGLMEFLVVRAIELLGARGVHELSLNFAAFARLLHSPRSRHERALAKLVCSADRFFQVESLYRFNVKFTPRWQPRYLLYEGRFGLTRAGLAAMRAEGQLPKPRLRRTAQPSGA